MTPSSDDLEDLLLCCRYGELEQVKEFVEKFGIEYLASSKDERSNTCLHYASANGHQDVVKYLVENLPHSSLSIPNESLSTPLHWASLNGHLSILKILCPLLTVSELNLKNQRGRTPMGEAAGRAENVIVSNRSKSKPSEGEGNDEDVDEEEFGDERKKWEEIVGYLLGFLKISNERGDDEKENEGNVDDVDVVVKGEEEEVTKGVEDIKISINDAPKDVKE